MQNFDHVLCDLGASVIVMPKVVFDNFNYTTLSHTPLCLQPRPNGTLLGKNSGEHSCENQ